MTDGIPYLTVREATVSTGIPERTIRNWIKRGKLAALPSASGKGRMVSLGDVLNLAATAQQHGILVAATAHTTTAHAGTAAALTSTSGSDAGHIVIAHWEGLYRELLNAKDAELSAKDQLIAELRRHVDSAEHQPVQQAQESPSPRPLYPFRAHWERLKQRIRR
jgi:excisionase family DNA binding protein